ncbi:MAG TPA: phosphoserine phosphatase SerB [Bacteroidales bacterium]|nr:phosphoserine phosphatase SerB [Bacteroidales bacterium]
MAAAKEVILLNISGPDKPGITATLTHILEQYDTAVLDIGQAVIHDQLSLGILFEVPENDDSAPVLKDLLFRSYELGVTARFTPITLDDYEDWVKLQGKERYIVTLIARIINSSHIAKVTDIIHRQNLNIDIINRLSGRPSLQDSDPHAIACVEFSVRGTPADKEKMRREFLEVAQETMIDIAFQEDNIYRRNRRLVCFDMDSTLIQTEMIVELAKRAGVGEVVHKVTESAMRGEIDFKESFRQRVGLLKGLDESVMREIAFHMPVTEGAHKLVSTLRKYGYKTAILSGGFTYFGRFLQHELGIDYVFGNELEIKDGKLTGNYIGDIVDGACKAELLKNLAFKEGIHLEQVIAVGDGANDLPMLNLAGLGIAFHAKSKVKENARQAISTIGLDAILYLMGFRDRELK